MFSRILPSLNALTTLALALIPAISLAQLGVRHDRNDHPHQLQRAQYFQQDAHNHSPHVTHLPHQGQWRACDARMPATNLHYPSQTCRQSSRNFLAHWQRNFHLRKQCPSGMAMRGISQITCTDAPMLGFKSGSVYNATVCCEPSYSAAASSPLSQSAPVFTQHTQSFTLPNIEMRLESTAKMPCPELGISHPRATVSFVPLLRAQEPGLDRRCAAQGGSRFLSAVIHSCSAQPNPRTPRQTQYFGEMDLVCAR
jgi:hypothetical protein